jgi:hypothetical protein
MILRARMAGPRVSVRDRQPFCGGVCYGERTHVALHVLATWPLRTFNTEGPLFILEIRTPPTMLEQMIVPYFNARESLFILFAKDEGCVLI